MLLIVQICNARQIHCTIDIGASLFGLFIWLWDAMCWGIHFSGGFSLNHNLKKTVNDSNRMNCNSFCNYYRTIAHRFCSVGELNSIIWLWSIIFDGKQWEISIEIFAVSKKPRIKLCTLKETGEFAYLKLYHFSFWWF